MYRCIGLGPDLCIKQDLRLREIRFVSYFDDDEIATFQNIFTSSKLLSQNSRLQMVRIQSNFLLGGIRK